MDCSPPGSSVHGISQARVLEWVAISFSRGSSQPRDQTCISCIGTFITEPPGKPFHMQANRICAFLCLLSSPGMIIFKSVYVPAIGIISLCFIAKQ